MANCVDAFPFTLLGNNHLIFMGGGGQEDFSEPENFFCLFLEQENFFLPALRAWLFFLNIPELISLNRGWGGGGMQETFFKEQNTSFL